ncbi:MAG: acyl-CoA dehydratase activase-related protein [Tannerella sp.]|jgi:predicted CoA-substrate-specific enzyme activase|nr:acyl-CoA dehydratase activase-related protein [Tannerella sp.]
MENIDITYKAGIDAGSTTLKVIVLDAGNNIVYRSYKRHKADINRVFAEEAGLIASRFPGARFRMKVTGSAGMGISERTGIPFVQEVVASVEVIGRMYPGIHTLIDLGGEDSKMVFLTAGRPPDIRMNGSCAGGTGSFIDQMADLMNISVEKLGEEALKCRKIYPVASRCGVFAKTDVQHLISRHIPVADIAGSILHTVVLQNITSLARGREITPAILCTGGPLTFIPALRHSFREILKLDGSGLILPENSEYFPAWGCALSCREEEEIQPVPATVITGMKASAPAAAKNALPALFKDEAEYEDWKSTRNVKRLKRVAPDGKKNIRCFLGIDSGSTTTKILVMDGDGQIVYTFYAPNGGNPLKRAVEGLEQFYREAQEKNISFRFAASAATGYGEDLVKSALGLDFGIVETMAHLAGARHVDPDVSFVLDIGGQDIKSIFTEKGVISNIELNESCSSGCGSFLQNFAAAMNLSLPEFAKLACLAQSPSDLGSRCTVFMNSKVKQALRQNDTPGDIAAGLAWSVVKNCLFKVLKISNLNRLGDHIVVQGGAFRNDAVYRALELLSGKSVSSTGSPELMGALGAALYAREREPRQTSFTGTEALPDVDGVHAKELQCKGCTNKCTVLRMKFENGNVCYAGNRCERVFYSNRTAAAKGYNAFEFKNAVLFDRKGDAANPALKIGIPRVLNMYENYPFWYALLTGCGFETVLSPESTFPLYRKGVGSVMSDNICFPAKLVHGHILSLAGCGVDRIFYPIVPLEEKEFRGSCNSFNCPVVSGYPDVIRSAVDPEGQHGVPFDRPVITFHDRGALERGCRAWLSSLGVAAAVFKRAFTQALEEHSRYRQQIYRRQKQLLDEAVADGRPVFIVAGRPYHADPLIHQNAGQILSGLGVTALTEDVFRTGCDEGFDRLDIVSQWSYPNRVIQAAMEVARLPQNVQLIQLNSFGCGPDSFFMDEAARILRQAGKIHTVLRIDEIASPGSIRLRLRSLIESLKTGGAATGQAEKRPFRGYAGAYTAADRRKTILVPWFTDFISPFVPAVGKLLGYTVENLPRSSRASADAGLKYGNNEVCYPSILILGDIITALRSGRYDPDGVAVAITQTGGQCRATNYLAQIKSGLENSGFPRIPVVVLSTGEVYRNEQDAFKLPVRKYAGIIIYSILYGDALQQMYSSTVIREKEKGGTQRLFDFYMRQGVEAVRRNDSGQLLELLGQAVADFNRTPVHRREYAKVGLVGEIFVKYNSFGQARTTEWLRERGVEVVTPPVIDFFLQYFVNSKVNDQNGTSPAGLLQKILTPVLRKYMNRRMNRVESILKKYRFHTPAESISAKAAYASEVLDLSHQFGEGWMIAAEVACFSRAGIRKVVCVQPFGCIANHVVAKGIERRLKKLYPDISLLFLDIDGGMAEVNLQNRLHFLVSS